MNAHTDSAIYELTELAREEGIKLPFPADYIAFLERHGRLVDLVSGEVVYSRLVAVPTPNAQAIVHLLAELHGEIVI
jgi:hypothetical protein